MIVHQATKEKQIVKIIKERVKILDMIEKERNQDIEVRNLQETILVKLAKKMSVVNQKII
jgi:hypothetical protein